MYDLPNSPLTLHGSRFIKFSISSAWDVIHEFCISYVFLCFLELGRPIGEPKVVVITSNLCKKMVAHILFHQFSCLCTTLATYKIHC